MNEHGDSRRARSMQDAIALLSPPTMQMLISFRDHSSFKAVSDELHFDQRTVRTRLNDLDSAYTRALGTPLLNRERHKAWALTAAGMQLAQQAAEVLDRLHKAMDELSPSPTLPVIVTSQELPLLKQLIDALPTRNDRNFDVRAEYRRSAELKLTELTTGSAEFFVFSSLCDLGRDYTIQKGVPWTQISGQEMLPIEIKRLQVISRTELFPDRSSVSIQELLDQGVRFLTPSGGVAHDFLYQSMPTLTFGHQRRNIPDLQCGLQALACELEPPRTCMIVHGIDDARLAEAGLHNGDVFRLDISDSDNKQWRAVTSIVRVQRRPQDKPTDMAETLWETARRLWQRSTPTDKEREVTLRPRSDGSDERTAS